MKIYRFDIGSRRTEHEFECGAVVHIFEEL